VPKKSETENKIRKNQEKPQSMNAELTKNQRRRRNQQVRKARTTVKVVEVKKTQTPRRRRNRRARAQRRGGNPYLAALLDPKNNPGIKIPDVTSFPSSTFQTVINGIATTNINPAIPSYGDSVGIYAVPCLTNPITLSYGPGPGSLSGLTSIPWPNYSVLDNMYSGVRPVSAILEADFVGSTSADGGYWITSLTSRGVSIPYTVGGCLATLPNMETETLASRHVEVKWRPEDNRDMEYLPGGASTRPTYPGCNIIATAMSVGEVAVSWVKWTFTVNWEALPEAEVLDLVQPSPSPIDLGSFQTALNTISRVNPTSFSRALSNLNGLLSTARMGYNAISAVRSGSLGGFSLSQLTGRNNFPRLN